VSAIEVTTGAEGVLGVPGDVGEESLLPPPLHALISTNSEVIDRFEATINSAVRLPRMRLSEGVEGTGLMREDRAR
jgi:hypothetical protein